jgi:hypothetical protein
MYFCQKLVLYYGSLYNVLYLIWCQGVSEMLMWFMIATATDTLQPATVLSLLCHLINLNEAG